MELTGQNKPDRKTMTRKAISVAWPAMTESFFVTLAGMIDTMMVAAMGSYAVAAVGLTNQPKFIGLTLFFGVNIAVSALIARRKGEQRRDRVPGAAHLPARAGKPQVCRPELVAPFAHAVRLVDGHDGDEVR